MKTVLVAVMLAVVGSGCGALSAIELEGFDDVECSPTESGGQLCRTKVHFHVERGVAEADGVFASVDTPWGSTSFDLVIDRDGGHSWRMAFAQEGACDEGRATLSAYLELIDEFEGSHEETADDDSGSDTVDVRCLEE